MPRPQPRRRRRTIPTTFTRECSLTIDRAAMEQRAKDDERIPIALSSELAVLRAYWWEGEKYFEVLDHSEGSVDLSYARDGMPLLLEHKRGDQIGILEDVTVDKDRKLRAMARFSRGAKGSEIRQDILDGIRTKVSLGYSKGDQYEQIEGKDGGVPTRRYTRWTPMEGSVVSIPADYAVGVGRSGRTTERDDDDAEEPDDEDTDDELAADDVEEGEGEGAAAGEVDEETEEPRSADGAVLETRNQPPQSALEARRHRVSGNATTAPGNGAAPPAAENPNVRVEATKAERERVNWIRALGKTHRVKDDRVDAWINDGATKEEVERAILKDYESGVRSITPEAPDEALRLTEKEEKRYSIVRGINNLLAGKRDGFEFEISEELRKASPVQTKGGLLVPTSLRATLPGGRKIDDATISAIRALDPNLAQRTQLSVGGANKGAELKFTEFASFIDLLRARATIVRRGAQLLSGLQGDLGFVGQTAPGTFSWGAETANAALSSASLALRTMGPKIGQSRTSYTRMLLAQSVIDVENLVRNDLAQIHALGIDLAGINGAGGNAPTGIIQTAGIGSVAGGANGLAPTWDHIVDLQKEVAVDNAWFGAMGYITTPGIAATLMKTQKFAGTNGAEIWQGNILDATVAGFGASATTQVPSNLTKGTSAGVCHAIIFGAFDSILIGEWGAMEILVDPYKQGPAIVEVASFQMLNVFLRYVVQFAAMLDALAT